MFVFFSAILSSAWTFVPHAYPRIYIHQRWDMCISLSQKRQRQCAVELFALALLGSLNTFTFIVIGIVSLLFFRAYSSYLKMLEDKKNIEAVDADLTELNQELETSEMDKKK